MSQNSVILQVTPVIDYSVRELCYRPYQGHKKGCPNYSKKRGCPPGAKLYDSVYDLNEPIYAIVNVFDFVSHVNRMKELHPEWSQRQSECCLYWQPRARKELLQNIKYFLSKYSGYKVETCPEAMGVNVTDTLKNADFILEWPPKNISCQVALAAKLIVRKL